MSALNESRSTGSVRRPSVREVVPANPSTAEEIIRIRGQLLGNVHSSPATTEQTLRAPRPNFISADNVNTLPFIVLSETPNLRAIHQEHQQLNQENERVGNLEVRQGHLLPSAFKESFQESNSVAVSMATLETSAHSNEEQEIEEIDRKFYDSGVDDAKTFPMLPTVLRRKSDHVAKKGRQSMSVQSLPDLCRIQSNFSAATFWVGTTDPDVVIGILDMYSEIDVVYMSPKLPPTAPDYSPYYMHMVLPGCVDVMNYCVVGRQSVVRYINGKQPHRMSTKRWAFEQKVTVKLRNNKFFKNFRLIKAFNA
ncbi:uncharacterized protein LOC131956124 [Physella acuta]|uniref:uncharacterized protein LOC131956124 n=1 Tax=Physella acuta TaxID=109671 RepID=UPI0027DC007F|nr:uncharacterized protein LOC131956124 [Physella acuta]